MYYVTFINSNTKTDRTDQIDLFDSILTAKPHALQKSSIPYTEYCTVQTSNIIETPANLLQKQRLYQRLSLFIKGNHERIKEIIENKDSYYTTFRIPKTSGGFRTIEAPNEELKSLLRTIKDLLQDWCFIHPHNAAFAYVPHRNAKHAIERHQYNQSKHYLHLDLKDFFTSCTPQFIHQQLKQIYPFCTLYEEPEKVQIIDIIVQLATYKEHLPQGTPLSPYLTNILMIPIDYEIYNMCKQRNKQHFVYTRYADDIDISSKYDFDYKAILQEIDLILAKTSPLKINRTKVHYGTTAGRNWHLGLMINQENKITIGHKRKKEIKALLLNFCKNKETWTKNDMQSLQGELAYFRSIEPEYHDYVIQNYSKKYNNNQDILITLKTSIA